MDILQRIASLEYDAKFLREENDRRHKMIVFACNAIEQIHDKLDKYIASNDEIRDIIGEKLFMIFYTVFPEAVEADNALKRAMKAQKKKPKE